MAARCPAKLLMGHDPANDVTLIVWTSLTLSLDGKATANTLMVKILDKIYTVSPLQKAKEDPGAEVHPVKANPTRSVNTILQW